MNYPAYLITLTDEELSDKLSGFLNDDEVKACAKERNHLERCCVWYIKEIHRGRQFHWLRLKWFNILSKLEFLLR